MRLAPRLRKRLDAKPRKSAPNERVERFVLLNPRLDAPGQKFRERTVESKSVLTAGVNGDCSRSMA